MLIHPEDCAQLEIKTGERVEIGNTRGAITLHAKSFDGVQRGVIVVESIWPNSAFEGGIGVNSLVGADPARLTGARRSTTARCGSDVWLDPRESP